MTQNIEIIDIHLVIVEPDLTIRISLFSARKKESSIGLLIWIGSNHTWDTRQP